MTGRAKTGLAVGLVALALVLAGVWVVHERPLAEHLDAGELSPEALDTLQVSDRQVTASLTGTVQRTDDDEALVGTEWAAFPVRGLGADSLRRGDRVIAHGRVRDGLLGRYLDAEALTVVTVTLRPGERRSGERPTVQLED